ncbi:MAG: CHC2 zinc finger domain-containing protein [Geobacteraceae bacterium]|nr:CHC2 zinc finger domain-containing protein [Geobacteraceae bacterium]
MVETIRRNAALFGIPMKTAVRMRLRFLKSRMVELQEEIAEYSVPGRQDDVWAIYCVRDSQRELNPLEFEAKTLIRFLRHGASEKTSLPKAMIAPAREYPFGKLLQFKGKMTHCPFHDDRNPSMALYGNRVHCFVCNRSWDAIDFVMERQGLKFREAVRHLTTEIR